MRTAAQGRMAAGVLLCMAAGLCGLCGGCAAGPNKADPWEKTNRGIYNFNEGLDRVVLKPVADGYVKVIPKPIRNGIGNGFDNLIYFNVVFCDLLEAKWGQGLGDFGRFAINSTVGIGGIFDPATPWGLPAHENDFGVVLGKWGCGPGPYLVLPLLGPSTLRDAPAYGVEYAATPTTYLCLPIGLTLPLGTLDVVDLRSRSDILVRFRSQTALDPYVFTREAYLQYREAKIREGKPATDQSVYDEDMDTTAGTTQPATKAGE
jgi:phospholipid-binding lipoprotein MlaA